MFACRRVLLLSLLATLSAAASVRAQDALPLALQAPVLLKALSYDRALARNGSGDLVLAVVYDGTSAASVAAKSDFVRAARAGRVQQVSGRALRLVEVNAAAGDIAGVLRERRAAAAYLTAGLDERLPALLRAARSAAVTTLAGSQKYARSGVAVAVDAVGGRPQLFINLPAARAVGADLPTTVLSLATVIQ